MSSGMSESEWGEDAWLSRMNHMREAEKNTGVTQRSEASGTTDAVGWVDKSGRGKYNEADNFVYSL
jgi:hypothetical protein